VNDTFVAFCNEHGLHTLQDVVNADPSLTFPAGVAEFKTAWMDIDPKDGVIGDFSDYVTTTAWVSALSQDSSAVGTINEDANHPRQIKVALVAAHAVYTLPGHPEFIWASLQHVNQGGGDMASNQGAEVGVTPNSAPALQKNPSDSDPDNQLVSDPAATTGSYLLYKQNTAVQYANTAYADADLFLDPSDPTQTFRLSSDHSIAQTSIYREFPGSKSNDVHPDDAVVSLNSNFAALVKQMAPKDPRGNYRLVGGTWMDKPFFFRPDSDLQIESSPLYAEMTAQDEAMFAGVSQHDVDPSDGSLGRLQLLMNGITPAQDVHDNGTDSPFSIMAGENRMSSTAMESFTQSALPSSFANCFACHNTQGITDHGTPVGKGAGKTLLGPKLINVSHVFSEFVRDECNVNPTAQGCN
jgi:hypothetical protein